MAKRSELSPAHYADLKLKVRQRDGHRCRHCKRRDGLQCHHIQFRSDRGPDKTWNLVTLCLDCHDLVHSKRLPQLLTIVAKSGNSKDKPNADIGLRFLTI